MNWELVSDLKYKVSQLLWVVYLWVLSCNPSLEDSFDVSPKPFNTVEARTVGRLLKRVKVKFNELKVCWVQVCSMSVKDKKGFIVFNFFLTLEFRHF